MKTRTTVKTISTGGGCCGSTPNQGSQTNSGTTQTSTSCCG